jgi:hypothetical protein
MRLWPSLHFSLRSIFLINKQQHYKYNILKFLFSFQIKVIRTLCLSHGESRVRVISHGTVNSRKDAIGRRKERERKKDKKSGRWRQRQSAEENYIHVVVTWITEIQQHRLDWELEYWEVWGKRSAKRKRLNEIQREEEM